RIVGGVCPTFSVPGIRSSGTIFQNLYIAVVGANEPMPRVSKKLVTNPINDSHKKANGTPEARNHIHAYPAPRIARATSSISRGVSIEATIARGPGPQPLALAAPPPPFKQHDARRHGNIERRDCSGHRNAHQHVAMFLHELVQAWPFAAENHHRRRGV